MIDIYKEANLSDFIISHLFSMRSKRISHRILWERVNKRFKTNEKTFNQNIYRLKKKGLISMHSDDIALSHQNFNNLFKYRLIHDKPTNTQKIILLFDIPEKQRKTRNWLRNQIKSWDFKMIQQSVWLGNGELPKEFYSRVKFLGVDKNIKIFKIKKSENNFIF